MWAIWKQCQDGSQNGAWAADFFRPKRVWCYSTKEFAEQEIQEVSGMLKHMSYEAREYSPDCGEAIYARR